MVGVVAVVAVVAVVVSAGGGLVVTGARYGAMGGSLLAMGDSLLVAMVFWGAGGEEIAARPQFRPAIQSPGTATDSDQRRPQHPRPPAPSALFWVPFFPLLEPKQPHAPTMCDCGGGGGSSTSDNLSPSQSQLTNRINRRGTDPVVHTVGGSMKATDVSRLEQKCVLVGNVAVGKSSIVNRYTRGEYLAQYQATIGAAFVPKEVSLEQGKSIKLQIWDTAGEEKYRAMTQFYYRKAAAGVVVFGLDDRQSFNGIKGWIDELREAQPNVIILVAGNKSDIDPDDRAIGEEEIEDLVDELGVCYMEVSALDGSNVDMLFLEVAQNIYDNPDAWATA